MKLHYSVENGGDGSAYPIFFATEKLAEWHQDHLQEGWGEPCTGSIEIQGTCSAAITVEQHYIELVCDVYDEDGKKNLKDFISTFFPDGLPEFAVAVKDQDYFSIFIGEKWVCQKYAYPDSTEENRIKLEKQINSKEI